MKWIAHILLVWCAVHTAGAQEDQSEPDDQNDIVVFADFGFSGTMPAAKHGPIRVTVQAQHENITGHIELEYRGRFGTTGRVVAPIDVAAGGLGSVSIVVPLPEWIDVLTITLRSERGKRLAETEYALMPDSAQLQMPVLIGAQEEMFVAATSRCLPVNITEKLLEAGWASEAVKNEEGLQQQSVRVLSAQRFTKVRGASVQPSRLPLAQIAYEGVQVLLADATTVRKADPRAIATIQRWVIGGGRLVVLADTPGDLWRDLLPPSVPADSIRIGPQQQADIPPEITAFTGESSNAQILGRPMQLDLLAADAGWRVRWGDDSGAFLAEGPAGFGWVTVVTVHPDTVSSLGLDANWRLWADVLNASELAVLNEDSSVRSLHVVDRNWRYRGLAQHLPMQIFDSISMATPISGIAIVLVALVTVSLALALGPIDFVLLRWLKIRQFAWLTALCWIALASVFAITMPNRLRAGPSAASRLIVVDQFAINSVLPGGARHPANQAIASIPEELRAWRLGFTNLFAGSSKPFYFEPDQAGPYWTEYPAGATATVMRRPMTTVQLPKSGGLDAVRSSVPREISPGIWSTKVYTDSGPMVPELEVSLEPDDRGWRAVVTGLDESASIVSGQLAIGDEFYKLSARGLGKVAANPAEFVFDRDFMSDTASVGWDDRIANETDRPYFRSWQYETTLEDLMPGEIQKMPGPLERTLACKRLLETGNFGIIELFVIEQSLDILISSDEQVSSRSTVYRIIVPIEGGLPSD